MYDHTVRGYQRMKIAESQESSMKEVFGFVLFVVFNLKKYLCQDRQLAQKVSSLEVSVLLPAASSAS